MSVEKQYEALLAEHNALLAHVEGLREELERQKLGVAVMLTSIGQQEYVTQLRTEKERLKGESEEMQRDITGAHSPRINRLEQRNAELRAEIQRPGRQK